MQRTPSPSCVVPLAAAALCASLMLGCVTVEPPGPALDLYSKGRVIQIELSMAEDDWADLLAEQRHSLDVLGASCGVEPPVDRYTWFPADVRIDGTLVPDIAVRKKGFFGSISPDKPSIKLDFAEFVPDQALSGVKRTTLNTTSPTRPRSSSAWATPSTSAPACPRPGAPSRWCRSTAARSAPTPTSNP